MLILILLILGISSISLIQLIPTKAERAVAANLNSLKNLDTDTIRQYMSDETYASSGKNKEEITDLPDEAIDVFKEFAKYLNYKIISSTDSETKAAVKVSITTIDTEVLLKDYYKEVLTYNISNTLSGGKTEDVTETDPTILYYAFLLELMQNNTYDTTTQTATILLTNEAGDWVINPTQELENILMGNFAENAAKPNPLTPAETVDCYFGVLKEMSTTDFLSYLGISNLFFMEMDSSSEIDLALAEQVLSCFDYTIVNMDIGATTAVVTVDLTTFSWEGIFSHYTDYLLAYSATSDAITDSAEKRSATLSQALLKIIQSNKDTIITTVSMPLSNSDGMWHMEYTSDLTGGLFGNLNEAPAAFDAILSAKIAEQNGDD